MTRLDVPRPSGYPCWVDLHAPDAAAAAAFYAPLLGWEYDVSGEEYGHYHVALVDERPAAGIGEGAEGGPPRAWTVYFATDDVDATTERARGLGATVAFEPMEVPGQGRLALLQDSTGAFFGLWQSRGHGGFGVMQRAGTMAWCEVNTPDAASAESFYTALLGVDSAPVEGAGTTYHSLGRGDERVAGILQMNEQWEGVPPHWMVYFEVEDADRAAEVVRGGGGTVSHGPFDTPFGRIVVASDPNGAAFSVLQPPA